MAGVEIPLSTAVMVVFPDARRLPPILELLPDLMVDVVRASAAQLVMPMVLMADAARSTGIVGQLQDIVWLRMAARTDAQRVLVVLVESTLAPYHQARAQLLSQ